MVYIRHRTEIIPADRNGPATAKEHTSWRNTTSSNKAVQHAIIAIGIRTIIGRRTLNLVMTSAHTANWQTRTHRAYTGANFTDASVVVRVPLIICICSTCMSV